MNELFYRPVVIETEEQARALSEDTVAYSDHVAEYPIRRGVAVKSEDGLWYSSTAWEFILDDYMIGWTAMVPVTLDKIFEEYDEEINALPDIYGVD